MLQCNSLETAIFCLSTKVNMRTFMSPRDVFMVIAIVVVRRSWGTVVRQVEREALLMDLSVRVCVICQSVFFVAFI